jgi:hypothetical protein
MTEWIAQYRGARAPALRQDLGRPRGRRTADGTCLLYIDRHLVHEVTSPQAFEGLRMNRPQGPRARATLAVVDHNVPTTDRSLRHQDEESRIQVEALARTPRFRRRVLQRARQAPGHRPHRRPRAGLHPAGHDHRLRRQPHLDAWRVRRAGARHRHLRGRACARHPDADPEEGQEHAGAVDGSCPKASPPRTSSSPSSARSAPPAAPATSSNMPARRSARCRWKAA